MWLLLSEAVLKLLLGCRYMFVRKTTLLLERTKAKFLFFAKHIAQRQQCKDIAMNINIEGLQINV